MMLDEKDNRKCVIEAYVDSHHEETIDLLRKLAVIPAPSGQEERRAAFVLEWLHQIGAKSAFTDAAGNVIFSYQCDACRDFVVVMAHMDVVCPDKDALLLKETRERLIAPGVRDDTANLVNMMMSIKFLLSHPEIRLKNGILFVADVGEEGLGNLKGSRQILKTYGSRSREWISFDLNYDTLYTRAVGSRRYRISVQTKGGHSYHDFGSANAIAQLSEVICDLYQMHLPDAQEPGKWRGKEMFKGSNTLGGKGTLEEPDALGGQEMFKESNALGGKGTLKEPDTLDGQDTLKEPGILREEKEALEELEALRKQEKPAMSAKATYNVGVIEGGTSVNTIAQEASMLFEIRSESENVLCDMDKLLHAILQKHRENGVCICEEVIGIRPGNGPVDAQKQRKLEERCLAAISMYHKDKVTCMSGSTDCNAALAAGIPAVTLGTALGEGTHTREEWVDIESMRTGQKIALQILLSYCEE